MSKNIVLSEAEMKEYIPEQFILSFIEQCRSEFDLDKQDFNILDWGCGRGRFVSYLRGMGYNAFGVDIDPVPILNSRQYFLTHKIGDEATLCLIDSNGGVDFNNGFFHCVISNQVLEHVEHLNKVAAEIQRVTIFNGEGLHVFPSRWRIIEPHLFIPFVHWLPKRWLRRSYIFVFVLMGLGPKWNELEEEKTGDKVKVFSDYSVNKTFYRSVSIIQEVFKSCGLDPMFLSTEYLRGYSKIKKIPFVDALIKNGVFRKIVNWVLINFTVIALHTKKK